MHLDHSKHLDAEEEGRAKDVTMPSCGTVVVTGELRGSVPVGVDGQMLSLDGGGDAFLLTYGP